MKPLTQYGKTAEKHWRTFRPKMVAELEAQNQLQAMLLTAEEQTEMELGPDSAEPDPRGIDAATSARPGLGNGLSAIHLPAVGVVADVDEIEAPALCVSDEPEPARNQRNYHITDADRIGVGSLKQKCRDNVAAIELLKKLEAENRPATDDEKRVVVRYVG